jgi:DNA polymerase
LQPEGDVAASTDARSLEVAVEACRRCRNCPLYLRATQSVFGEGPVGAPLMLVGEQPGDEEDREGRPFVGPAGALLDKALADVGLSRDELYVTNAVKHFKFVERGKRRLHEKPSAREVRACSPWLEEELRLVHPRVIVAMGATAASSLFGPRVAVMRDRGRILSLPSLGSHGQPVAAVVTIHPSAALRAPTHERRRELRDMLVADLRVARGVAETGAGAGSVLS